jgi:signal transduction histidine kinase
MRDSDLQELQKDTFDILVLLVGIYGFILLYTMMIKTYVLDHLIPHWWLPSAIIFVTCIYSYKLRKRNQYRRGSYVFIGGLIVAVISFIFLSRSQFQQREAYLFILIVAMAGLLINPQAAADAAGFAVVATLGTAFVVGGISWDSFISLFSLFPPLALTCGMAAVSWVSSDHLTTTLQWAMDSQARAQQRSRELFEKQQELQKAYLMLETANLRLQQAEAAANQANRFKTRFVTSLSHELRTPLSAIINFSFILAKDHHGTVTNEQRDYLTRIHDAGNLLLEIVNDLLDLAKIESGQMEIFREPIDLAPIASSVMNTISGLVTSQVKLWQDVPAGLPQVDGDETRIRQIMLNLLSNAAKYTEKGQITLRIAQADAQFVRISIIDTGIGIKEEDFERIFEEFQQTEDAFAMRKVGTGLGLPISKKFVELHGGQLWLESEYGRGSTFHFTLPISSKSKTTSARPALQQDIMHEKVINL